MGYLCFAADRGVDEMGVGTDASTVGNDGAALDDGSGQDRHALAQMGGGIDGDLVRVGHVDATVDPTLDDPAPEKCFDTNSGRAGANHFETPWVVHGFDVVAGLVQYGGHFGADVLKAGSAVASAQCRYEKVGSEAVDGSPTTGHISD